MKVKCLYTTGEGLDNYTLENSGDTKHTIYPLKANEIYTVYGQSIFNGILNYLIKGTYENLPSWYPAVLFEVVNSLLHFEWYFIFNTNSKLSAIWGYRELVFDINHYNGLIDREKEDIAIFLKRKQEIDEFEE